MRPCVHGVAALAALAALFATGLARADALHLQSITPAGIEAPANAQIVLGFDRAMVPLGRMERRADEVPVTITPQTDCRWRWLDPQNLACQLGDGASLRAATTYTVESKADNTALDGSTLDTPRTHRFYTQTPKLEYASVAELRGPAEPLLRVWFDQPVSAGSVRAALSFDGAPVTIEPDLYDSDVPFYTPDGEARQLWRVAPAAPLPADREVALRIAPGLRSALGTARGSEAREVLKLQTFGAPRVLGLQCSDGQKTYRVDAQTRCAPLEGVGVIFNVPVSGKALRAALTMTPAVKAQTEASEDDGDVGEDGGDVAPLHVHAVALGIRRQALGDLRREIARQ